MVNGATKPKKRKIIKRVKSDDVTPEKESKVVAPKKKRVVKKRKPSAPDTISDIKKKKVADPKKHNIEDYEVEDINAPISFDITTHAPSREDIANFGDDKRAGFNLETMLANAQKSMGSIFDNLTNDSKTFGSKMDSVLSLQMLSLLPTVQNLDDTMYDERKAHAAIKLNETINHLKNSLVQKQQFELKEEVDLHHPKIQKSLTFLTEAFFYVLTEVGIDSSVKALIVNALSLKMMGFEDELNKRFKGVAFSLLEQVENPLLESLPNVRQLENMQRVEEKEKEKKNLDDEYEDDTIIDVIPDRNNQG